MICTGEGNYSLEIGLQPPDLIRLLPRHPYVPVSALAVSLKMSGLQPRDLKSHWTRQETDDSLGR